MKGLIKANLRKLSKSVFYILGLIIAVVATYLFTNETIGLESHFSGMTPAGRMVFISIAIAFFFTIYTPLTTCSEYSEGIIRAKVVSGHTQKDIYFAGLITNIIAAFIMLIANVIGGVAAGARPTGKELIVGFVTFCAIVAFISFVYTLSFRLVKPVRSVIFSFLLINICFNMMLFGNFLIMISEGFINKLMIVLYNVNVIGQWFANSPFTGGEADPGKVVQLLISAAIIFISVLIGTSKINKRDIV